MIGHKEEGRGKIISVEWFIYLFLPPIQYEWSFPYCNNGILDNGSADVVGHVKS